MSIICYDTEFLEDGNTIDLVSIGLIDEHENTYYAVNVDCDFKRVRARDWLWQNVVPQLPTTKQDWNTPSLSRWVTELDRESACVKPKWVIANEVRDFIRLKPEPIELWAYYGAYDHVALCQLWGQMIDLPNNIPMWTHDIMQLIETLPDYPLPAPPIGAHNALIDARWGMDVIKAMKELAATR